MLSIRNTPISASLATLSALRPLCRVAVRFASTIQTSNDPKMIDLLGRLDKFDQKTKIFDKLDELYLLSQRKGFFNVNSNNLRFMSNNNLISDKFRNLYNFNDLNKIVANHYSNLMMLPVVTNSGEAATSMMLPNSPMQGLQLLTGTHMIYSRNSPVDKYLRLMNSLAKNDVELKAKIERILGSFDKEDDYFFNYVLEFWITGKSFNKMRAKKLQDQQAAGGDGSLPHKMAM